MSAVKVTTFLSYGSGSHRNLPSFPTRRSSDLVPSMCRCSSAFGRSTSSSRIEGLPALGHCGCALRDLVGRDVLRSEEHTSELQSHVNLVCRLLLEKKNT